MQAGHRSGATRRAFSAAMTALAARRQVQQLLARLFLRGPRAPGSCGARRTRQAPDAVSLASGAHAAGSSAEDAHRASAQKRPRTAATSRGRRPACYLQRSMHHAARGAAGAAAACPHNGGLRVPQAARCGAAGRRAWRRARGRRALTMSAPCAFMSSPCVWCSHFLVAAAARSASSLARASACAARRARLQPQLAVPSSRRDKALD